MRTSQAAHSSLFSWQTWSRVSLATVCVLTLGCGGATPPEEQATNTPAPPPAAVTAPASSAVTEPEPEPEPSETPSAMDIYVEQRRAERKARGPIKYPPRPPEQAQPKTDLSATPAPATSATPSDLSDDESSIDANASPGAAEMNEDEDS